MPLSLRFALKRRSARESSKRPNVGSLAGTRGHFSLRSLKHTERHLTLLKTARIGLES